MVNIALNQFEQFILVAETGSITQAAESLHVTKSALSQSIKQLEDALKVPLFFRTTRKITLTHEGELLLAQCQRLKSELDTTRHLVGNFHEKPRGLLRISAPFYLANKVLLKLVEQYQKRYENIKVELIIEERLPNFHKENLDIAFGINWPPHEDIIRRPIGKTKYILCASPKYLKNHGTPTRLSELAGHSYLHHTGRGKENFLVGVKNPNSLGLTISFSANNAEIIKQAALNSMGIIQLHRYIVEKEILSQKLIPLLEDELIVNTPLYIYYYKHRYVQPKIRKFVMLACENIDIDI